MGNRWYCFKNFLTIFLRRYLRIGKNDLEIHAHNLSEEKLIAIVKSLLFGVAVGDSIGVPLEFTKREIIRIKPITDMIGYGTYNLPPGTFSDDSSLTFCLAEALCNEFDLNLIGQNFVKWLNHNYWTATGHVFDIGNGTQQAIRRLEKGIRPDLAGGIEVSSNGNGSLMRIAPLVFYLLDKPIHERYEIIKQVSSITHGHVRSVNACFYYLEFARLIYMRKDKFEIYETLKTKITDYLIFSLMDPKELEFFDRLLKQNIFETEEEKILSGGYVIHTLEASIWCLMTTNNYEEAILKAVNLGEDTDTTGAVTGALAGLLYGFDCIPKKWVNQIARKKDIVVLSQSFARRYLYNP